MATDDLPHFVPLTSNMTNQNPRRRKRIYELESLPGMQKPTEKKQYFPGRKLERSVIEAQKAQHRKPRFSLSIRRRKPEEPRAVAQRQEEPRMAVEPQEGLSASRKGKFFARGRPAPSLPRGYGSRLLGGERRRKSIRAAKGQMKGFEVYAVQARKGGTTYYKIKLNGRPFTGTYDSKDEAIARIQEMREFAETEYNATTSQLRRDDSKFLNETLAKYRTHPLFVKVTDATVRPPKRLRA